MHLSKSLAFRSLNTPMWNTDDAEMFDRSPATVHFQPFYSLETREIAGLEALLRLTDDHGVMRPPSASKLSQLECGSNGLALLSWVYEKIASLPSVYEKNLSGCVISVNVRPADLLHSIFSEATLQVHGELRRLGYGGLQIEIVERYPILDIIQTAKVIAHLEANGVAIALDDFGSGFSSFNYLYTLPNSTVKIDKFYSLNSHNNQIKNLLKQMVDFCKQQGRKVLVEGIETHEQLALMQTLKVDQVQGFLFGRPKEFSALQHTKRAH